MLASFVSSRPERSMHVYSVILSFSDSLQPHRACQALCPWNFPGENIEVGCHFLLQGIFLTQGSNPGLLYLPVCGRPRFNPWVRKIPWRRKWQPTPVLLPGKSHGWRILVGYRPWGRKESDTTEQICFLFFKPHLLVLPSSTLTPGY